MRLLRGCLCAAAAEAGKVRGKDEGAWREDNVVARGPASGTVGKNTTTARSAGKEESVRRRWRLQTGRKEWSSDLGQKGYRTRPVFAGPVYLLQKLIFLIQKPS